MTKDIILLDLFSGIGGFTKGLQEAGFNIIKHYYSEIDKHAIAVYKYHFKNAEYVGSVTSLDGRTITRPNIITFGSPCQDFSLAGQRKGLRGGKSSLIEHAIRLIAECRPDLFIWENVKGVFSANNSADFWTVIKAFADIGGYRLEWQLLNTSWFLPQNRERIYLVGQIAEAGRDFKGVFPFRESDSIFTKGNRTQRGGSGEFCGTITSNLKRGVHAGGETYIVEQENPSIVEYRRQSSEVRKYPDNCPSLCSKMGTGGGNIPYVVTQVGRGNNKGGDFDICPTISSNSFEHNNILRPRPKDNLVFYGGLNPPNRGDGSLSRDYSEQDRVYDADQSKEAATINATSNSKCLNRKTIRRLTEIECERLQGFDDNWTKYGDYDGVIKEVAPTQRYKLCGNAVTVATVKAIGVRIINNL